VLPAPTERVQSGHRRIVREKHDSNGLMRGPHGGEEVAEDFVCGGNGLGSGDFLIGFDVGDGRAKSSAQAKYREEEGLANESERGVEGNERVGHFGDRSGDDLGPVFGRSRVGQMY